MLCTTQNCIYAHASRGYLSLYVLSHHDAPNHDGTGSIVSYSRTTKYKCPNGHISLDKNVVSIAVVFPEQDRKGTSTPASRFRNRADRHNRAAARRR